MSRIARVAVDWDGTLTEDDRWPEVGGWLPGAVDALKCLAEVYDEVVIYSCRVADWETDEVTPRNNEDQIELIENMLLDAEIPPNVYVWTRSYKPMAKAYIDNRGVRFNGNWAKTLQVLFHVA